MSITINDFTRVKPSSMGNPRYVLHFLKMMNEEERFNYNLSIGSKYTIALNRAKKLGGKKFHNKQYGGGIVFQHYNLHSLSEKLNDLISKS